MKIKKPSETWRIVPYWLDPATLCSACGKLHLLSAMDAGTDRELKRLCEQCFKRENKTPLDHSTLDGSTGEPRVKTLLLSMLAALDRNDVNSYWLIFGRLLSLHKSMISNVEKGGGK